jgi:hypothetical protein
MAHAQGPEPRTQGKKVQTRSSPTPTAKQKALHATDSTPPQRHPSSKREVQSLARGAKSSARGAINSTHVAPSVAYEAKSPARHASKPRARGFLPRARLCASPATHRSPREQRSIVCRPNLLPRDRRSN